MLKELALQIGPLRRLYEHRNHLLGELDAARQASGRTSSPFFHYAANFDALGTMRRYAAANLQPTPGLVTNWLGVKVEPKVYPPALAERAGTVEPVPIPANWHADIAEWAAVLQAVDNANADSFTMIELGCGWGCWMSNSGAAARSTGRRVHVIGVEGDEDHIQFARETLAANGFSPDQTTLHRGVAAATDGIALFPRQ